MNAQAWQENPRVSAMVERVYQFMKEPAPRTIPQDIWRRARSPVAVFFVVFGLFIAAFEVVMFLVVVSTAGLFWAAWTMPAVIPGGLFLVGLLSLASSRKVLSAGQLYKGKVISVTPLPARINGRSFFSAAVEFEGRGGARIRGKETIDNWCSEYFLDARDKGDDVDVIYAPNTMGKVVLPMKIALGTRYD